MNVVLGNISNGLVYPHHQPCWFQSNHAHNYQTGYFAKDSMPWTAVINMFVNPEDTYTIVDATRRHKKITDAQKFGVPTWLIMFNGALGLNPNGKKVCPWETPEMKKAGASSVHHELRQQIRRVQRYYPPRGTPLILGENFFLECHQNAVWDDKPDRIKEALCKRDPFLVK